MTKNSGLFRALPSVDALLAAFGAREYNALAASLPRALLKDLINEYLDECRQGIKNGKIKKEAELGLPGLMPALAAYVRYQGRPHFRRVLNATGVVIHTNLGRSLLAPEAVRAVSEACGRYSNLEFNLDTGERGSRYSHVEKLICRLIGTEAALVVNNNAAAVLLILDSLCKGREVITARGQLVEIGGSFRIPDVMRRSGCALVEVGCTNRCHLNDYAEAITENTAALLKVHTSNYRVVGFHKEVPLKELAALGRERGIPVIEDLGSGSLCDFAALGLNTLQDEPTIIKVAEDGADVLSFSGDKVLGGPQAGVIAGRAEYIDVIKKNPLNRALRIDKMTLAAMEATLRLYLDPEQARRRIPTLRMICAPPQELRARALRLARRISRVLRGLADISVLSGASRVGGGSFPERDLPTSLISISSPGCPPLELRQRLLRASPPLAGRVENETFCLDVRTLDDDEFSLAASALRFALADWPETRG